MLVGQIAGSGHLVTVLIECGGLADIVAILMEPLEVPGNDNALGVIPGPLTDSIPGVDQASTRWSWARNTRGLA